MTQVSRLLLIGLLLVSLPLPAFAGAETVTVVQEPTQGEAIIQRRNGERWFLELGTGCLALSRYVGKHAVISSPGIFAGVGSQLLLPDDDQSCRIWNAKEL